MKFSIRLLYLYLFAFIGLLVAVIGSIRLLELGLKVYVFQGSDSYDYVKPVLVEGQTSVNTDEEKAVQEKETKRQRQREASGAISMLLVGIPLYKYHWDLIKKEGKKK